MTNRLTQLTRHFVIDTTKFLCKPTCFFEAREFAKAALVLQTNPQLIDPMWRKDNPVLKIDYMGDFMSFDTEKLYADVDIAARPNCQCCPELILRSNDGIHPEK